MIRRVDQRALQQRAPQPDQVLPKAQAPQTIAANQLGQVPGAGSERRIIPPQSQQLPIRFTPAPPVVPGLMIQEPIRPQERPQPNPAPPQDVGGAWIGGPGDQGQVYVPNFGQMTPEQQNQAIANIKGNTWGTATPAQGVPIPPGSPAAGVEMVGKTPEGFWYDANGQFYNQGGWPLDQSYYMGNQGRMYANPNDPSWGLPNAGGDAYALQDAYQPQPALDPANFPPPAWPQDLPQVQGWDPQHVVPGINTAAPVRNPMPQIGNGQIQGRAGQGLNYNQLLDRYNQRLDAGHNGQQFMANHPRFADRYNNTRQAGGPGPLGGGGQGPINGSVGGTVEFPTQGQGQGLGQGQTPGQAGQNPGAGQGSSLTLSPQAEQLRRSLESELSRELSQIGVAEEQIPAALTVLNARLAADQDEALREANEAANARGVYNSGIRTNSRKRVTDTFDRTRSEVASDVARQYGDLASRKSAAYSNFNTSWAEALLEFARIAAEDPNAVVGLGNDRPSDRPSGPTGASGQGGSPKNPGSKNKRKPRQNKKKKKRR